MFAFEVRSNVVEMYGTVRRDTEVAQKDGAQQAFCNTRCGEDCRASRGPHLQAAVGILTFILAV